MSNRTQTQADGGGGRFLPRGAWRVVFALVIGFTALAVVPVEAQPAPAPGAEVAAIVPGAGCQQHALARNDDGSSSRVTLPFTVRLYNRTYSSLFVNNNGNVTFQSSLPTYTPNPINAADKPIIAPFWADVDTRPATSGVTQYGTTRFQGRQAFCVNWINVGYYSNHTATTNSFQLLLVKRHGSGAGNFDAIFNYGQIAWETGDASGGTGGLGGSSARAGISNGFGRTYEISGSGVPGAFLDANPSGLVHRSRGTTVPGRFVFRVRSGDPLA